MVESDAAESGVASAWEPETVICLGRGIWIPSGIYSLKLLFRLWPPAPFSRFIPDAELLRAFSFAVWTKPWYAFRLVWFAIAAEIDSPLTVTNAASALFGIAVSLDGGRTSFLHGPGESPDISGDGRGVTSGIALRFGDDRAEPGRDPPPTLLANTFLMLGVRAKIGRGTICEKSPDARAVCALAAVTMHPGMRSVCIRRPALEGLGLVLPSAVPSDAGNRDEVFTDNNNDGSF
jgi:hypothetical protein